MLNSFALGSHAGAWPACNPTQFIARGIVPGTADSDPLQFAAFFRFDGNPLRRQASAIVEPCKRIKCGSRFDISPQNAIAERFQMTLTVAHISPIMSVIAGLLILIMPRLLNLVVAIFLILNGLIGLGLLKWLHM
jgi:Protein of unknown function (DUF3096)